MPDGWVLCYSKQHDRAYFFFGREGRSTWDFPGVHEDLKGGEYALDGDDDERGEARDRGVVSALRTRSRPRRST